MEQEEVPQGAPPPQMSMSGATTANGSTGTSPAAAQNQGTVTLFNFERVESEKIMRFCHAFFSVLAECFSGTCAQCLIF